MLIRLSKSCAKVVDNMLITRFQNFYKNFERCIDEIGLTNKENRMLTTRKVISVD
mgnify:CR=1 FL=1